MCRPDWHQIVNLSANFIQWVFQNDQLSQTFTILVYREHTRRLNARVNKKYQVWKAIPEDLAHSQAQFRLNFLVLQALMQKVDEAFTKAIDNLYDSTFSVHF